MHKQKLVSRVKDLSIDFNGDKLSDLASIISKWIEIYGSESYLTVELSTDDYNESYIDIFLNQVTIETDEQYIARIEYNTRYDADLKLKRKQIYDELKKEFDN